MTPAQSPQGLPSEVLRLGSTALSDLQAISDCAAARLEVATGTRPKTSVLATPNYVAEQKIAAISQNEIQALGVIRRQPAIARIEVRWRDTQAVQTVYLCRSSAAGIIPPVDGTLASYYSRLGRIAETPVGDEVTIQLPKGPRAAEVLSYVEFHPLLEENMIDSIDNIFKLIGRSLGVVSLRKLIKIVAQKEATPASETEFDLIAELLRQEEESQLLFHQKRRAVLDRMELRDRPILDQHQGELFRLPIDTRVVLLGPPGTGKTTTLVKRVGQKLMEEGLDPDELTELDRRGIREQYFANSSWVLFSPSDLLKLYVREAFNREHVPAQEDNLRTWASERRRLGREVLDFLATGNRKGCTLSTSEEYLKSTTSEAQRKLFDDFSPFVEQEILRNCAQAIEWMETHRSPEAQRFGRQIRARFGRNALSVDTVCEMAKTDEAVAKLQNELKSRTETSINGLARILLAPDPTERFRELFTTLAAGGAGPVSVPDDEGEADEETDVAPLGDRWDETQRLKMAKIVVSLVRALALETASGRGQNPRGIVARSAVWLKPVQLDRASLLELGDNLQLAKKLRLLNSAAHSLVFGVSSAYLRYRRTAGLSKGHYQGALSGGGNSQRLGPLEADVVILAMLRNAATVARRLPAASWLQPILKHRLMQVFVDEMTDFSAVQLAAMLALTHPAFRSWFACGDFRQRISISGIQGPQDLEWIRSVMSAPDIEVRQIHQEYRQSERLKHLATALETGKVPTSLAVGDDPPPLLAENLDMRATSQWLADRVSDVERAVGRLPSIAVFVPSEEDIDIVVNNCLPFFAEHNLHIVGCKAGRDVGNSQEVRVFDVHHIKGLEFEAVFFLGVDQLAAERPGLFKQFLYVGITRAARYLGIACRGKLPVSLSPIRTAFSYENWC
jgi:hypothetical protein